MRKMKRNRIYLVIVMTFVISAFLLLMLIPKDSMALTDEKNEVYQKLEQKINEKDVAVIEEEIRFSNSQLYGNDNDGSFTDAVLFGDSMSEALLDYGLLDSYQCFGIRGARIDQFDDQYEQMNHRDSVKVFFLQFGLNDTKYWKTDEAFIECYIEKINMIKKDYPDAEIYVNSILPMAKETIEKEPAYQRIPSLNEQLSAMCEKEGVHYLDASSILEKMDDPYEPDGIHPKFPFYEDWLAYMIWSADL